MHRGYAGGITFHTYNGSTTAGTNIFETNERMRITGAGNVGINRTSPGYKLEVGGVILGTGGLYSHALVLAGNSTDGAPSFAMVNDPDTGWRSDLSNNMRFITGGTARMVINSSGNVLPAADNSYSLGSSSARWANIFSADLHLSNVGTGGNEVDGTEGDWTIQEGEEELYLLNNKNGKKYKFMLQEIK